MREIMSHLHDVLAVMVVLVYLDFMNIVQFSYKIVQILGIIPKSIAIVLEQFLIWLTVNFLTDVIQIALVTTARLEEFSEVFD